MPQLNSGTKNGGTKRGHNERRKELMSEHSAKMWSGRFREPLDPTFDHWQRSIRFDRQLLQRRDRGQQGACTRALGSGLLTRTESQRLRMVWTGSLHGIQPRESGSVNTQTSVDAEDIHHFVEMKLVEAIGDLGLKLHTGRSRNEQIATDLRLYVRVRIADTDRASWRVGARAGRAGQSASAMR